MIKQSLFPWLLIVPFMLSCKSFSYFESANNLRNVEGTLHLQNGRSYTGKLIVNTDNVFGSPLKLYEAGDKKPMRFDLHDVKSYAVNGHHYEAKEISEPLSIGRRLLFMKRLTPEGSRLHLYELLRRETVNKTAVRYHREYYMQLPGKEEAFVFATDGATFVPNFDKKVSLLLKDCLALAQKIKAKKKGYFYHLIEPSAEKRLLVLRRIIDEYNNCEW